MHDTAIVIVSMEQDLGWIKSLKVPLSAWSDVSIVDGDILVPVKNIFNIFALRKPDCYYLSGLECSCQTPRACNISCSIVPERRQPPL